MKLARNFEYPEALEKKFNKAKKLEWFTIFYFLTAVIFMALVMGNSQAMKTAWLEDALSLIPPVCFLISSKIYSKASDNNFPYGYHRVISIAFLISSVALTAVGFFLLADSSITLIKAEHPTINSIMINGHQVWMGYIMIAVLLYSTVPSMVLGLKKKPLAEELHEKNLYTDAEMNKADWMTGIAGIVGITGIGIGWWWADAAAAIIISFDILYDGLTHLKMAILDLMDMVPKLIQTKKTDPIFAKIRKEVEKEPWVRECEIRFRQEGHVYFGEIFIVPSGTENITSKIESLREKISGMNWRVYDVTVSLVKEL